MTSFVVFDDGLAGGADLSPVCDLRASFELRTGAMTTLQRLEQQVGQPAAALIVPTGLDVVLSTRCDTPINRLPEGDEPLLFVNGRLVSFDLRPPHEVNTAVVDPHGAVVAALLDADQARVFVAGDCAEPPDEVDVQPLEDVRLLRRPWQILANLESTLQADLAMMNGYARYQPEPGQMVGTIGDHDVRVGREVVIHPMTVFNTARGPIVLDDHVQVHAHSVIFGPCYIGPHTLVTHRSDVGASSVGPWCKLGGDVNACVIQGYSNKCHAGYLGSSYLGEWVNLGAATTTSNMKNTYGAIAMRQHPHAADEPTEMLRLGTIMGDHVKTAIGTRLLTGSCVGTGAMIAVSTFAPRCVKPFAFMTDAAPDQRYILERFALVADRMMQRRGKRVTAELAQRFAQLMAMS